MERRIEREKLRRSASTQEQNEKKGGLGRQSLEIYNKGTGGTKTETGLDPKKYRHLLAHVLGTCWPRGNVTTRRERREEIATFFEERGTVTKE